MAKDIKAASTGLSILTVVGIVFIVLKCVGTLQWPWWWILAPFWLPYAVAVGFILLMVFIAMLLKIFE